MKKAKNHRPKNLNDLSVASKKVTKEGALLACSVAKCRVIKNGDTTLTLCIVKPKAVKKKHKKRKRNSQLIEKIGWILFAVLADFFVSYFLTKLLS